MFAEYIKTNQITFKHAKGMRDILGQEFHTFHEIFLLIGGDATFTCDHFTEQIHPATLVIIPKEQFHQFDHIGDEKDYHRYVLQFDHVDMLDSIIPEVFDHIKVISNIHPKTIALFERLGSLITQNFSDEDKHKMLHALLTELLIDLKYNYTEIKTVSGNHNACVFKIIDYIHEHYLDNITIKDISQNLNFSETYISHKFKEVMHISVYKYIIQKKLLYAHRLLCSGTPSTTAAQLCGFKEYSGFYRMYKKQFGVPPSKTR